VSYATVIRWFGGIAFVSAVEEFLESSPTKDRDEVDDAILLAIAEYPFDSVRDLSRLICMARNSVHRRLMTSLDFTVHHLRWVLRVLSDAQKRTQAHMSGKILQLLQIQNARA
jgi:hypothetical protein